MSNTNIENAICDAVDILVSKAIDNAGYDRTIQAMVLDCVDPSIGKYKIKYQDTITYAYSTGVDVSYSKNTMVYVLIPSNDNGKDKTILGAVKKSGLDYITVIDDADRFDIDGVNVVIQEGEIGLNSYDSYNTRHVIEVYDKNKTNNQLKVDTRGAELYIKSNGHILCGAHVRTALPSAQRRLGNYGIIFTLEMTYGLETYTLDINGITGNPYQQSGDIRQKKIFPINQKDFVSIRRVELFADHFPDLPENDKKQNDIFFRDIELSSAFEYPEEDLNSCHLSIITPQGRYFDELNIDDKTLKAQVRIKSKVVNNDDIQFYWFVQSAIINVNSEYYNTYGGVGWKCLNTGSSGIVDSSKDSITIRKSDILATEVRYKCVAIYNTNKMEAEISMINDDANYRIELVTSTGETNFSENATPPSIECKVFNKQNVQYSVNNFLYYWGYDQNGIQNSAEDDEVDKNIWKEVNLHSIMGFRTYRCSIYSAMTSDLIGTGYITISNILAVREDYKVRIKNGQKVFMYSEDGKAPTENKKAPLILSALEYEIVDGFGKLLDETEYKKWQSVWKVPKENTMLTAPIYGDGVVNGDYVDYKSKTTFSYDIASDFNVRADHNNITLELYNAEQDRRIYAETSFVFTKQGAPGTNGTEFTVVISPNDNSGAVKFAELSNRGFNFNYSGHFLKAEFYRNGEQIFSTTGNTSGTSTEQLPVTATWSVLKDKKDFSSVDMDNWTFDRTEEADKYKDVYNIVKVKLDYGRGNKSPDEVNGVTEYYGFASIITKYCASGYDIQYVPYSGFTDVIYSSAGENPIYGNDPFEIKVYYNGVDVTSNYSYGWSILGTNQNIRKFTDRYGSEDPKKQPNETLYGSKHFFKPINKYNGLDTDDAVLVEVSDGVGWIKIPVHFSLDRYANKGINDWDGNSITLDEDNGIILAPQVGAGYKDTNNKFNGVLMGAVKEYNTNKQETGLFGFSEGARSFFLNAKDGSAIFGKAGQGQIIIDPSGDKGAIIKSGNYDNTDNQFIECEYQDKDGNHSYRFGSSDGMIMSTLDGEHHNQGMIINLDLPYIHWGNGNFAVTPEGYLVAKGGGSIAGWNIGDHSLYNTVHKIEKHKDPSTGEIIEEILDTTHTIGMNSTRTNSNKQAFWAGLDSNELKKLNIDEPDDIKHTFFCVGLDGQLTAYNAILKNVFVDRLQIGNDSIYWEIKDENITYHKYNNTLVTLNKDNVEGEGWGLSNTSLIFGDYHFDNSGFAIGQFQLIKQASDNNWIMTDTGVNQGMFLQARHFQSVDSLPANPDPATWYFIRGNGGSPGGGDTGGDSPSESDQGNMTDGQWNQVLRALDYLNIERTSNGLSPFSWNSLLNSLASRRALEIAAVFSHLRPDGTTQDNELIAYGYITGQDVISAMMETTNESYKTMILDSDKRSVSIAVYVDASGTWYWAFEFSTEMNSTDSTKLRAIAMQTFNMMNSNRSNQGLNPLVWNDELETCSNVRATEISVLYSHTRPNGKPWYSVNSKIMHGENIGTGHSTAQDMFEYWMSDPSDKNNILWSSYTKVAISIYVATTGIWYWACVFGD